MAAGRVLGPFVKIPIASFRSSGLGAIPKKNGKWRMILHLSAPYGGSVNDGIHEEQFPVHYATVDDAVDLISRFGTGAILAKIDLKAAFRMVSIHPDDWDLLGMQWQGSFYMYLDTCLPFGLRSAPFLFNQFAEVLHWILHNNYQVDAVHFLIVGAPGADQSAIISPIDPEGVRESGHSSGPGQAGVTSYSHLIPGHHAGLGGSDPVSASGQAGVHSAQGTLMAGAPQCHQT